MGLIDWFFSGRKAAEGDKEPAHSAEKGKTSFWEETPVQKMRREAGEDLSKPKGKYKFWEETPVQKHRRLNGEKLGETKKTKWWQETEVQRMRRLNGEKLGR